MDSREFAKKVQQRVAEFCKGLDDSLPAYSYIPLTTDEMRIKVMQSRLFNEVRAAEVFGTWLKTTPQVEIKAILAEAIYEEFVHAEYLSEALKSKGAVPYDYKPVPAQMAMFNGFEALTDTCERIAAFPFAGEGVADYLIGKSLQGRHRARVGHRPLPEDPRRRGRARQLSLRSARQICHHCRDPGPRRAGRGDEPHAPAPVLRQSRPVGLRR